MNKKTWILLVVFLLLVAILVWRLFFYEDQKNHWKREIQFAVTDIGQVDKILIADRKKAKPVVLSKQGNRWLVNDTFPAKPANVELVLDLLENVRVRNRPLPSMRNFIEESLIENNVKIQAMDATGRILTDFYIGGTTHDQLGNFMVKEGSNAVFIGHIPNNQGSIRERLVKNKLEDWRNKRLLELEPERIQRVRIEYPKQKIKSFELQRIKSGFLITPLHPLPDAPKELHAQTTAVDAYLEVYSLVGTEDFENDYEHKDLVLQMTPFAVLEVETKNGNTEKFTFYPKMPYDAENNTFYMHDDEKDIRRYWIYSEKGDFYMAQQHQVLKLFMDYNSIAQK